MYVWLSPGPLMQIRCRNTDTQRPKGPDTHSASIYIYAWWLLLLGVCCWRLDQETMSSWEDEWGAGIRPGGGVNKINSFRPIPDYKTADSHCSFRALLYSKNIPPTSISQYVIQSVTKFKSIKQRKDPFKLKHCCVSGQRHLTGNSKWREEHHALKTSLPEPLWTRAPAVQEVCHWTSSSQCMKHLLLVTSLRVDPIRGVKRSCFHSDAGCRSKTDTDTQT